MADDREKIRRRNRVGCIDIEERGGWHASDNLAIALATYFEGHMDRPSDDEDDPDTGWGEWVTEKTNEALDRIAEDVFREPKDNWDIGGGYR